jgi:hypothetical protein
LIEQRRAHRKGVGRLSFASLTGVFADLISELIDECAHVVDANLTQHVVQRATFQLFTSEIHQIHRCSFVLEQDEHHQ